MSKIEINYDVIKNAEGFEYADNKAGVSCRLVPIEEAREQDKKLKVYEDIEKKLGMPLDKFFLLINKKVKRVYYDPHKMTHKIFLEKHDLVDLVLYKSITMRGLGFGLIVLPLKDYGKTWAFTEEELKSKC